MPVRRILVKESHAASHNNNNNNNNNSINNNKNHNNKSNSTNNINNNNMDEEDGHPPITETVINPMFEEDMDDEDNIDVEDLDNNQSEETTLDEEVAESTVGVSDAGGAQHLMSDKLKDSEADVRKDEHLDVEERKDHLMPIVIIDENGNNDILVESMEDEIMEEDINEDDTADFTVLTALHDESRLEVLEFIDDDDGNDNNDDHDDHQEPNGGSLPVEDAIVINEEYLGDDFNTEHKDLIALLPSTAAGGPRSLRPSWSEDDALRHRGTSNRTESWGSSMVDDNALRAVSRRSVDFDVDECVEKHGAPMKERKERRNRRASARKISTWRELQLSAAMWWKLFKEKMGEVLSSMRLWKTAMKEIEGEFGNGVLSYFLFVRFLLLLNFFILGIELLLIVPQTLINYNILTNVANYTNSTKPQPPPDYLSNKSTSDQILDFFTGQGFINTTIMFYSNYHGAIVIGKEGLVYNMPLAYLTVGGAYMVSCFLVMMWNFSETFTDAMMGSHEMFHSYCNKVFASWDFCIVSGKAAKLKKEVIYHGFKADLVEEKRLEDIERRTLLDKAKIYCIRVLINILWLALLCGSITAIYLCVELSSETSEVSASTELTMSNLESMLKRWSSPLCISGLNIVLPPLFDILTRQEQHSPSIEIAISLLRSVFLKIASLVVLLVSVFTVSKDRSQNHNCSYCWENKMASQMFNLILVDCLLICVVTIVVETGRKYAHKYLNFNNFQLGKHIGRPEFQIPKNILELVYGQSLIWLGTFFAPLMPVMGIIKLILIFYVKKTSLMFNCKTSSKSFQGARSNHWFTLLLLLVYLLCTIAISFSVSRMPTSSCGPFRNDPFHCEEKFMIDIVQNTIDHYFPGQVIMIINHAKTAVFIVPLALAIVLLLYYYYSMTQAHEKMIHLLEDQLKTEGKDKRYLMTKHRETAIRLKH